MLKKAEPVWAAGLEKEMNCELSFRVCLQNLTQATIAIATSAEYQLFINGKFIAFGPAKAAKGFFKIDAIEKRVMEAFLRVCVFHVRRLV